MTPNSWTRAETSSPLPRMSSNAGDPWWLTGMAHILGFTTLEGEPPKGVLGMLFVDPKAIGQGIGRLLFEHTIAAGREPGFAQITIDADPNAEPFYRTMGAVRIGNVPSGSIAGRVLPQMVVTIQH